jgi:hypothetical protein
MTTLRGPRRESTGFRVYANVAIALVAVLAIFFGVAFAVYGALSAVTGLQTPQDAPPATFLAGVLLAKLGHALAFVLIYYAARRSLSPHWLRYAFLWWLMFVLGEVGQVIVPGYSWQEALAGVVAETLYFPAAAWVTDRLVGRSLDVGRSGA